MNQFIPLTYSPELGWVLPDPRYAITAGLTTLSVIWLFNRFEERIYRTRGRKFPK